MQLRKLNLIPPNTYQHTLAELFSEEVFKTNGIYKDRNNSKDSKIKADIYRGKMAEFAVWNYLISLQRQATFPDIAVYPKEMKSYDADIIAGNNKIHVKSFMVGGDMPISWMFQPNDTLIVNPSDEEFIAFVIMFPVKRFEAYFVQANKVLDLYKSPTMAGINKKTIFEDDLIQLEL